MRPHKRNLLLTRTSSSYHSSLSSSWVLLCDYAKVHGLTSPATASLSDVAANSLLTAYIQHAYEKGEHIRHSRHAILAVQTAHRHLRGKLRQSWDGLQSWAEELPSSLRTPLPLLCFKAMVCLSRIFGLSSKGRAAFTWFVFANLLELGYWGMLRPGELFNLKREHVALPSSGILSVEAFTVLMIIKPKNKRSMGYKQFATVRSCSASAWSDFLFKDMDGASKLWHMSLAYFAKIFSKVVKHLQLSTFHFTPASLRAGGCTHAYQTGNEPSRLKFQGRWKSESSVAHYIQESMAQLVLIQLSPEAVNLLNSVVKHAEYTFDVPLQRFWEQ
jgi:integrase